jgi:hypothetical protein
MRQYYRQMRQNFHLIYTRQTSRFIINKNILENYRKNLQFPTSLVILDPKISQMIKICINLNELSSFDDYYHCMTTILVLIAKRETVISDMYTIGSNICFI